MHVAYTRTIADLMSMPSDKNDLPNHWNRCLPAGMADWDASTAVPDEYPTWPMPARLHHARWTRNREIWRPTKLAKPSMEEESTGTRAILYACFYLRA